MTRQLDHGERLPAVHLRTEDIPEEHHLEVWRQSCDRLFEVEPLTSNWVFPGDSSVYLLEQLIFTHVCFPETRFTRRPSHRASSDDDALLLQYNASGRQKGLLDDDTDLELGPDRITLQDFRHGYTAVSQTTDTFGVILPRHLLPAGELILRKQPVISWGIESSQGRMLLGNLRAIWRELATMKASEAESVSLGFAGLLNGVLHGDERVVNDPESENALRTAMMEYINVNLSRRDLSAELLSHTFQRSRATVYRLFQPIGGVQCYIRDLRLMHCFKEFLASSGARRGSIRAIAERWGFYDAAHFSNLFKKRYGLRPSDMIGCIDRDNAGRLRLDTTVNYRDPITTLREWTGRL